MSVFDWNSHLAAVPTAPGFTEALKAWPCGVWSETSQARFSSDAGEASSIVESGQSVVQCVALDDVLPHFKPTLIKFGHVHANKSGIQVASDGAAEESAKCVPDDDRHRPPAHCGCARLIGESRAKPPAQPPQYIAASISCFMRRPTHKGHVDGFRFDVTHGDFPETL
jgi:hypothetical protein